MLKKLSRDVWLIFIVMCIFSSMTKKAFRPVLHSCSPNPNDDTVQSVTVNEVCFVSSQHFSFSEPRPGPLVNYLLRNTAFPFLISAVCLCFENHILKVPSDKHRVISVTAKYFTSDHFWVCISFLNDISI